MARAPLTTILALAGALSLPSAAQDVSKPALTRAALAEAFLSDEDAAALGAPAPEDKDVHEIVLLVQKGPHPGEPAGNYAAKILAAADKLGVDPAIAQRVYAKRAPQLDRVGLAVAFRQGVDLEELIPIDIEKDLYEQARYIQRGREPGESAETFLVSVRSVARRLGVDYPTAERLYAERERPRGSNLPTNAELKARNDIAIDVRFNKGLSEMRRERVTQDLKRTSGALLLGLQNGELATLPSRAAPGASTPSVAPTVRPTPPPAARTTPAAAAAAAATTARNQPPAMRRNAPAPPAAVRAPSAAAPRGSDGLPRAYALASLAPAIVERPDLGFNAVKSAIITKVGYCLGAVRTAMGWSDVDFDVTRGSAKNFLSDLKRDPQMLDRMNYRRVDIPSLEKNPANVPEGSILFYPPGCSFADKTHGHIELTVDKTTYDRVKQSRRGLAERPVNPDELLVCHFNCTTRSMSFVQTYGTDGPPRRVNKRDGTPTTIPGRKACLSVYVPVRTDANLLLAGR